MPEQKIKNFTDLIVWKEGHKLVLFVYSLTKKFPKEEVFGLVSQMRRAVVSITSNVVEGFGRKGYREKIQFYYLAQGSLIELTNQIIISKDIKYISENEYDSLITQSENVHRLLQGLITKSKSFLIPNPNLNS
jgi:four helix bundle protein